MNPTPIVVAASDTDLTHSLALELEPAGYLTVEATAAHQLLLMLADRAPDALVLGDLPDLPASLRLLRGLRAGHDVPPTVNPAIPVLIRSASSSDMCELLALEAGADDFRALPCPPGVLRARVARLVDRARTTTRPERLILGRLTLDLSARTVRFADEPIVCRRLEFDLLKRLASEPTRVIGVPELLADVWGWADGSRTRTVDTTACTLRRKLAAAGAGGYIVNARGQGYRLLPPAAFGEQW
jgi:DNA-binding response OmpR family regulator